MFAAGKSGGVTTPTDQQFNYVTMLLHGDGTNGGQNNTFVDSSTNNFSITRNGNTTQGSFSPYGDLWSVNFGSSSTDMLSTASSSSFAFGSGDFTMEAFVYATASQTDNWIIGLHNNCWLRVGSGGALEFYNSVASSSIIAGSAMPTNQWVHVAAVRSGTTLTIYQNGTSVASGTVSTNFSTSVACTIGNQSGFDRRWNGYISNVRVVKGTAVYTGSFTPSTTSLTAITNTVLLTCQNNRFIDNSSNAFALTVGGSPKVTNFSPFLPTAAYSTATNGGSGYFDGAGDYLGLPSSTAFTFGTGDFTVEFWGYFTSTPNCHFISLNDGVGTDSPTGYYYLSYESNQFFSYGGNGGQGIFTAYTMPLNSWVHIVACRSGTTHSIFVNGTRIVTGTTSYSYTSGTNPTVGKGGPPSGSVTGYMSGVRLVKGSAVYDPSQSTLTVPTAPPTAITNTSLLLNFTNAAIFDNSMKNDLETVGNAQISTSVKKFGTGSLYFDRSGDWLAAAPSVNFAMGTGDFTIEGWVYFAGANANGNGILQITNGYLNSTETGPAIGVDNGSGYWAVYTTNSGSGASTTTPSVNTWYHFAMVRYSGTTKLYINGSSVYSVADSNNYQNQYLTVGGWYNSSYLLNGYIDDLRITKGVARYTANFTPPTAAFPNQ